MFQPKPTVSDGPKREVDKEITSPGMKNENEESNNTDTVDLRESYRKLEKRVKRLEDSVDQCKSEFQSLKDNRSQNSQQAQIQILYRNDGDHLQEVVRELESLLYGTLSQKMIKLVHCTKASDVQPRIPLLILCLNTTRLAVDAPLAIQGLQDLRKAALLIFHHKDSHSIPVNSSEKALKGYEYQDLRCIVDFAFQKEKGIYRCEMNETSEKTIINFINTSVDQETKEPFDNGLISSSSDRHDDSLV